MVELFSPYMLVFLIWSADNPAETMSMNYSIHTDEQTCEEGGAKKVAKVDSNQVPGGLLVAKAICTPTPDEESVRWRPKAED